MTPARSGRGLFRRGDTGGREKRTVIYSAIPADKFNGFHPSITIQQGGHEETLILDETVMGWLPALDRAKQFAQTLEAYEQRNP